MKADRQAEVRFGLDVEEPILADWAKLSGHAKGARGFLKGGRYDDFDFLIVGRDGTVSCYVEVKQRRVEFGKYGDVIFPLRKYALGKLVSGRGCALLVVTRYSCGTLVEVNLSQPPTKRLTIERRDRPGEAVPHVSYSGSKLTILRRPPDAPAR